MTFLNATIKKEIKCLNWKSSSWKIALIPLPNPKWEFGRSKKEIFDGDEDTFDKCSIFVDWNPEFLTERPKSDPTIYKIVKQFLNSIYSNNFLEWLFTISRQHVA